MIIDGDVTSQVRLLVMSKQQQAPGELELVREFVNTLDIEQGEEQLSSGAGLASWLVEHGLAPLGVAGEPAPIWRARSSCGRRCGRCCSRTTAIGSAPAAAYETLDDAVCRARVRLRFRPREAGAAAALEAEAGGVDGALGRILTIVHGAIAAGYLAPAEGLPSAHAASGRSTTTRRTVRGRGATWARAATGRRRGRIASATRAPSAALTGVPALRTTS